MVVKNLPYIRQQLLLHEKDPDTPAALIYCGTLASQKTVVGTLETIAEIAEREQITNPSMIVIGDVVKLHHKVSWFEPAIDTAWLAKGAF